jgi:hypothetical protein
MDIAWLLLTLIGKLFLVKVRGLVSVILSSLAPIADRLPEGPRPLGRTLAVAWCLPSLLPLNGGRRLALKTSLLWPVLGGSVLNKLIRSSFLSTSQLGSGICALMVMLSVNLGRYVVSS